MKIEEMTKHSFRFPKRGNEEQNKVDLKMREKMKSKDKLRKLSFPGVGDKA